MFSYKFVNKDESVLLNVSLRMRVGSELLPAPFNDISKTKQCAKENDHIHIHILKNLIFINQFFVITLLSVLKVAWCLLIREYSKVALFIKRATII